jgi:glycosyltransferase involved in cell wall biosynthesis
VVTHNRPQFLASCLQSIAAQTWTDRELVVVLNPPDDGSDELAEQFAERIIRTHRNIGFFPALNVGIANTRGSMLMVIDDDATFDTKRDLEDLVRFLLKNPAVSVVTSNIRGPCEGAPYQDCQKVHLFKAGFTLYRKEVFTKLVGYFPDRFYRAGGESYLANYIYEHGGSIAVLHDVWMYHAQTIQGRDTHAMNFFGIRNHALLAVLQEPLSIVPVSLAAKLVSSFIRIGVQRGDLVAWMAGWLSFAGNLAWAVRERRPISLRTYRYLRKLRRETGPAARVVIRQSAETA